MKHNADETLVSTLSRHFRERPDTEMLIAPNNQRISFGEFWAASGRAAAVLSERGVAVGDRVVTIAENSVELLVAIVASWRLSATVVPLNPNLPKEMIEDAIARIEPAAVLCDHAGASPTATYLLLAEVADGEDVGETLTLPAPDAAALIMFSSGTTGQSKGCVLSHGYLELYGHEFARMADLRADDRVFCVTAFYHINAFWALAGSIVNGTPHAFETKFSASAFWQRAADVQATVFDYVGAIIAILLRSVGNRPSECRLRACVGGGVIVEDIEEFERRFQCKVIEGYGLTECCSLSYQTLYDERRGSIGRPTEYFEVMVVDEDFSEVSAGTPGQLLIKSLHPHGFFEGYWRDPDKTAQAFHGDWFCTRDLVKRDTDGYLYFIERLGHVIRRRGENISCFHIEGIFAQHPQIRLATVVGVPAELGDEELLLAVELIDDSGLETLELLEWARARLPKFMLPRYIRFGTLPRTASERVERHRIKKLGITADTYDTQDFV